MTRKFTLVTVRVWRDGRAPWNGNLTISCRHSHVRATVKRVAASLAKAGFIVASMSGELLS